MNKTRAHLIIHGYVQGVYYRASTHETALRLGLKGWVRNLPDGNVEAVFEGPVDQIQKAIKWCEQGPRGARVTKIDLTWEECSQEFSGFEIRYGW